MSLNQLKLPKSVLTALYKNGLVCIEKKSIPKGQVNDGLPYLGDNLKNIAIIVSDSSAAYLSDKALKFLSGVLSACNLSLADVAIINIYKTSDPDYSLISKTLDPRVTLLFGASPTALRLPLHFPEYQIQRYNQQIYLSAPPLEFIENEKAEKQKLWNCLKTIFPIS